MAGINRSALVEKTAAEWATFLPIRDVTQLCGALALHARLSSGIVVLMDRFCEYAILSLEAACEQPVLSRMDGDTQGRVIAELAYFRRGEQYAQIGGCA